MYVRISRTIEQPITFADLNMIRCLTNKTIFHLIDYSSAPDENKNNPSMRRDPSETVENQ